MNEAKDVFISYHTKSSAEVVAQICAALEGAGISCWYAPRNVVGDYATSIVKAINSCRVFLLILNRDADVSEDVRNEINCAFERFRNHEDITLLPFKTDDFKLSEAVAYYIGRIHIMDGGIPPEMLKLRELVDRISTILGHKAELSYQTETAKGNTAYRLSGSMICADAKFVGRTAELAEIHDALHNDGNRVFLVGMGGIGKSELLRKYVQIHKDKYRLVLWITFHKSLMDTIGNDSSLEIQGMCRRDYPEDSDHEYFLRKLRILRQITDKNVLLIIDNFDVDGDPDLDEFLKGKYAVLFSTRNHQHHPYVSQIEIQAITDINELRTIFFSEYTRTVDEQALEQVDAILHLLYGHPLSIRLVAATMQSRRLTPQKMLELLKSGRDDMLQNNTRAAEMIYGQLDQIFNLSGLTEEETSLLCSLACLPLSGITVEEFYERCDFDDFDVIDRLVDRNWIIHNPASDEVHLHPRIAELMKKEINADSSRVLPLINSIRSDARSHQNMTFKNRSRLLEYVKNLYALHLDDRYIRFVAAASLGYLSEGFNRQNGVDLFTEALDMTDTLVDKLECFVKISHDYTLGTQFEKGLEYALIGCKELEAPGVDDDPPGHYRNKMWVRAGEALYYMGKYDESIAYLEKAIALCEQYDVHNKGWTYYHLASACMRKGDIDRAVKVADQATAIFAGCNDNWSIGHTQALMGKIMQAAGDIAKALEHQRTAIETFLKVYGQEDDSFATHYFRTGLLLRLNGNSEDAMNYFHRAKDIALKFNCPKKAEKIDRYIDDPTLTEPLELL